MALSLRIQTATIFLAVTMLAVICDESDGRELRPSDHGLDFQISPPPGKTPRGTASFFGGVGDSKESSPSSENVALPEATMRSNDTSWWTANEGGSGGKLHVRHVLLLASVGCGITGVALLLASAFIYVVWHKRQQRLSSSTSLSPPQPPPQQAVFGIQRK